MHTNRDFVIARDIMKLDPLRAGPDDAVFTTDRDWIMPGEYYYCDDNGAHRVPRYTASISAAWQVWHKVRDLNPHKAASFWSALRSHVQVRLDKEYLVGNAEAALYMEPVDICLAMLEAHGQRTLPAWYY